LRSKEGSCSQACDADTGARLPWAVGPVSLISQSYDRLTTEATSEETWIGKSGFTAKIKLSQDKGKERRSQELVYAQFHIWQPTRLVHETTQNLLLG